MNLLALVGRRSSVLQRKLQISHRYFSVQCALQPDEHGAKNLMISSSEPKWTEFNNQSYTIDKPGWINIEQRDANVRVGIPANAALELAFSQKDVVKSVAFLKQVELASLDRNTGVLKLAGKDGPVELQLADQVVPNFQAILRRHVLVAHGFESSSLDKTMQTASITIWGEDKSFGRIAVGSNGYIKFDVRQNGRMAKFTGIIVHPIASLLRDSGNWIDGTVRVEGFPPFNSEPGAGNCFVEVTEDSFLGDDDEGPSYTLTVGGDGSPLSKQLQHHEFLAFEEIIRFFINRVVDEDCASSAMFRQQHMGGMNEGKQASWSNKNTSKPVSQQQSGSPPSDFAAYHILD